MTITNLYIIYGVPLDRCQLGQLIETLIKKDNSHCSQVVRRFPSQSIRSLIENHCSGDNIFQESLENDLRPDGLTFKPSHHDCYDRVNVIGIIGVLNRCLSLADGYRGHQLTSVQKLDLLDYRRKLDKELPLLITDANIDKIIDNHYAVYMVSNSCHCCP